MAFINEGDVKPKIRKTYTPAEREKIKDAYKAEGMLEDYYKEFPYIEDEQSMNYEQEVSGSLKPNKENHFDEVVFISGPYRADTISKTLDNILAARNEAKKWWKLNYTVICPHLNSALMDGECNDENFLLGDLELLKRSNILVLIRGWDASEGAKMEKQVAKELGLKITYQISNPEE